PRLRGRRRGRCRSSCPEIKRCDNEIRLPTLQELRAARDKAGAAELLHGAHAFAGAADGGNGRGGGGATSLQALSNPLFSQLVAVTLTDVSATAAINPAVATEQ